MNYNYMSYNSYNGDPNPMNLFGKHLGALPIYRELERRIMEKFPKTNIVVYSDQIAFRYNRNFTLVSFMNLSKAKNLSNFITVTFQLERPYQDKRILMVSRDRARIWSHHVILTSPQEVDGELMDWVEKAYDYALRRT